MQDTFSPEWCRSTFQLLIFLDEVYEAIENHDVLKTNTITWGEGETNEEGIPEVVIGFQVRKPHKKANHLWVGFWQLGQEMKMGCPIWLQALKDEVWEPLIKQFPEAHQFEDDGAIGIEWPLPMDANLEAVREAGRNLGTRIIKVLSPPAQ
ncbi:hypothetical protein [Desulforhabdus amnigena]|uniref:Uncharacterized protein n=1 Tax=Desulforhabdus amnigena TaxID=40218 RepID=A0A9W6FU89_9BACT|nr:hypothetical protein [Desulforhabdus amnigena]NLJ27471.1 hypothetical protein [Deltaproteobacteria bacterium]GLI34991.1 hypothetical protein DAMNIGENAA_24240 [Desulforhabdus amnigena]